MAIFKKNEKNDSAILGIYMPDDFGHFRLFVKDGYYFTYLQNKLKANNITILETQMGSDFLTKILQTARTPEKTKQITEEYQDVATCQVIKLHKKDLSSLVRIIASYNIGLNIFDLMTRDWLTGIACENGGYDKLKEDFQGLRQYIEIKGSNSCPKGLSEGSYKQVQEQITSNRNRISGLVANIDFEAMHQACNFEPFKDVPNQVMREALTKAGGIAPDMIDENGNNILNFTIITILINGSNKNSDELLNFYTKNPSLNPLHENKYGLSALNLASIDPKLFELLKNSEAFKNCLLPESKSMNRESCLEKCMKILTKCQENNLEIIVPDFVSLSPQESRFLVERCKASYMKISINASVMKSGLAL